MKTSIGTIFKTAWQKIKRNPVLNAMVLAMVTQFLQDWRAGNLDLWHSIGYIAGIALGVWAREFTVPEKKHREAIDRIKVLKEAKRIDN